MSEKLVSIAQHDSERLDIFYEIARRFPEVDTDVLESLFTAFVD